MQSFVPHTALLVVFFCLAGASGCAEMTANLSDFGRRITRRSPEQVLDIKTPADRMKELRQLTKSAAKKSPAEQEQIVTRLLQEYQTENDPILRRHILRALVAFPQPAAGGLLIAALSDSDTETRRTACRCLGARGGNEAVAELSRVITSDTNFDVRIAAVRALGETGEAAALEPLAETMAEADPALRSRAREALTAVSGRDYGDDVAAWREYAKNGRTEAPEVNIAERIRRSLF